MPSGIGLVAADPVSAVNENDLEVAIASERIDVWCVAKPRLKGKSLDLIFQRLGRNHEDYQILNIDRKVLITTKSGFMP